MPFTNRWVILREGSRLRWGGDLRRRFVYDGLADLPSAAALEDRRPAVLGRTLRDLVGRRWFVWRRPHLASTEILTDEQLAVVEPWVRPAVVDVHDDPILQAEALGISLPPSERASIRHRLERNLQWFPLWTTPSAGLAALMGLDPDRVVVVPNGSRTDIVQPAPWPPTPAVGFVSGAAPRRGIEELLEAIRLVREIVPETELHLFLAATGPESAAYLDRLRSSLADDLRTTIGSVPYASLGQALGNTCVVVIPTPAHPYWDSVAPIKLFDAMAAGRPIVTTPRAATAAVVDREGVGLVATGDRPTDLADAIVTLLRDPERARSLGDVARRAAVDRYDWRVITAAAATEILERLTTTGRPWSRRSR